MEKKKKEEKRFVFCECQQGHWMIFAVSGLILYLKIWPSQDLRRTFYRLCVHSHRSERDPEILDKISILPKHELLYDYKVGHRSSSDGGKCV